MIAGLVTEVSNVIPIKLAPAAAQWRIVASGSKRELAEGELVFAERTNGDEMFILLEGRVQITIEMSRESEQAPVHTVTEGKVFGEFALLAGMNRSATARTIKDCRFFVLNRTDFQTLAEEDPKLGYTVLTACDGSEALELCGGQV